MCVTKTIANLTTYSRKAGDYNGTIMFEIDIMKNSSPLNLICRLWAEIEAHKWRDLELNLSKTVEELHQDSQLIQANSKKKLRDNKKLLECSFAQI